jgi:HYR domain-containing protein
MNSLFDPLKSLVSSRYFITKLAGGFLLPALLLCPQLLRAQSCIQVFCPTNISVPCEGPWGAHVSFAVVATNICPPPATQPTVTYSQDPGTIFPPGVTTVCATSSIPGAVSSVCCFTITVDTCCGTNCIKLICPPNFVFPCDAASGGAFVDLSQPQFAPQLTNLCGGPIPTSIVVGCSPAASATGPTFFPPGENTVICCLTNFAVQPPYVDCCCYKIFVLTNCVQTTDCRVIAICPTNVVVCTDNGTGTTNVPFLLPILTNTCPQRPVNIIGQSWTVPPGYFFPVGKTTVGVCVKWLDDFTGNTGTKCCCYDVFVTCCTNPCDSTLKCPDDMTLDCPGPNGIPLFYSVYATNSCYPKAFLDCTPPSGTIIFGNTNVCCKFEYADATGTLVVLTQCCFKVTVLCPSNCTPVINCPTNIFITCPRPVFAAANIQGAFVTYPPITATDSCGLPVTIFCNPPSGSFFPIGCRLVTCTAVDSAGNTVSCHFRVCVLPAGCYLKNPSFEIVITNAPTNCGEPVDDAASWTTLAGAPKLFQPPPAVPLNCWGYIYPCSGSNYAGISGGYNSAGLFQTDQMLGRTVVPLNNGKAYRVRACLSLATNSPGAAVLVEFVLANQANPAQQFVINQTWVQTRNFWQPVQYGSVPCFIVPRDGKVWDALIIRAAAAPAGSQYPTGQVFIDNVNICCCNLIRVDNPTGVNPNLTLAGPGVLQFSPAADFGRALTAGEIMDEGGLQLAPSLFQSWPMGFFRLLAPEMDTSDCDCYP